MVELCCALPGVCNAYTFFLHGLRRNVAAIADLPMSSHSSPAVSLNDTFIESEINISPLSNWLYAGLFSYVSGEASLAKFTQHYGISVHEAWAYAGLAPGSPTAIALEYDMQLLTMERLSNEWRILNCLDPEVVEDACPYVLAALQQAQQVLLSDGSVGVHGDLRQANVAVKRGEEGWLVKFVDFDWAGPAGLHRFPACMNSQIDWPDGVGPLAVMQPQHDVDLLALQFDRHED